MSESVGVWDTTRSAYQLEINHICIEGPLRTAMASQSGQILNLGTSLPWTLLLKCSWLVEWPRDFMCHMTTSLISSRGQYSSCCIISASTRWLVEDMYKTQKL